MLCRYCGHKLERQEINCSICGAKTEKSEIKIANTKKQELPKLKSKGRKSAKNIAEIKAKDAQNFKKVIGLLFFTINLFLVLYFVVRPIMLFLITTFVVFLFAGGNSSALSFENFLPLTEPITVAVFPRLSSTHIYIFQIIVFTVFILSTILLFRIFKSEKSAKKVPKPVRKIAHLAR